MEPVRPRVDAFVLNMLQTRTFRAGDFFENRHGVCRIVPSLTQLLAATAPTWAHAVAPIAARVVQDLLARNPKRRYRHYVTALTQLKRSIGRDSLRRHPVNPVSSRVIGMPQACQMCGVILDSPRRQYCDECFLQRRKEMVETWSDSGLRALARNRAGGWDPAHGGHAGYKRGRKNAEHLRAAAGWKREHESLSDTKDSARRILPGLQDVPLREMVKATGFSAGYCSLIRRGLRTPHPRHWDVFRDVSTAVT
jgi:hypothetical protein